MDINRSRFNELDEEFENKNVLKENCLNTDFSYEHILNNNIKRPQEIDCGMSCGSSFYERYENGNKIFENNLTEENINNKFIDGSHNLDNNFHDDNKKNNPVYIYNTTNGLDVSFKQINNEDFVKKISNIEINTLNKNNNIIKVSQNPIICYTDEKKIETNLNDGCIITKSIYNNKISSNEINQEYRENFPYISQYNDDVFFLNSNSICRGEESVGTTNLESNLISPYLGSNTVNYSNSIMSEKKLYFPETGKIESNNRYIINTEKNNSNYSSNEIKSNNNNSVNIISRTVLEEDINLVSKLDDVKLDATNKNNHNIENEYLEKNFNSEKKDIEKNIFSLSKEDIYNSVANEIMNYKNTIYDLETELKIKNSYLENEKKKNEGYEKIIEKYINNLNLPFHDNNSMSTFDINEIQIKQIKQELLLKSTEVIELNNAINNLKSQKALFINSVYNELQVSMKKETENSLILHAQTIRLNNANKYIESQSNKINNLVNELKKLEQRYIYHIQKDERIINELLNEKKEFVKIAEKLNIVNIENKNKNEELEKYKNKCNELTEELNDLVRVISDDQLVHQKTFNKSYQTNDLGFLMYMPNQKNVESTTSNCTRITKNRNSNRNTNSNTNAEDDYIRHDISESNNQDDVNNSNNLNNGLKIQLGKLIEHNDWLKSEVDKYFKKNTEIVEELKNKTKIISEQNKRYALLLEKYNILENDFKNIHDVCSQLEGKFKKEQCQNIMENKNMSDSFEKNESKELRKRNLSLKDLQINESNQSESNINDYKIYCSELKLENEALKVVIEKLKNKNKKLSKNMELLLNDLITNEQLNDEEVSNNNMIKNTTNISNLDNEHNQDNSQTVIYDMSKQATLQKDEHISKNTTLVNSIYQKEPMLLIKNEEVSIEKNYINESKKKMPTKTVDIFTQTEFSISEKTNALIQTEFNNSEKTNALIQTEFNNSEKTNAIIQTELNEYNKNCVTTGINTEEKTISNKCIITDNHVKPLIDACINTNKVKVINQDINMEYKSTQTNETDCYIKSTQTDFKKRIDRGVLTEMCGITDFNIKQIMIKNKILTKNKKIQVTVSNLNASIQTQETTSSDISKRPSNNYYNMNHTDKYKYNLFNINKDLRCIKKKKKYFKSSSSIYSSNSIDNIQLEDSNISSELCSFKNNNKYYYYKDDKNGYRDGIKRNKGCYYIKRQDSNNSYSDTSYDVNDYNDISNIYPLSQKKRHTKNILPICDMEYNREYYMKRNCPPLKYSRKYKNQDRSKYSKSYNRNEEEEVESLLEILKYSSEYENEKDEGNYEESQLSSNYRNEGRIEIYRNIIDNDSYYKKRMMKYRKREKKIKKINKSEKMFRRDQLDKLSQNENKHKIYKKLKNSNYMIKFENKHVQTDEQIFNDIFYDDINTHVKNNFSDIIDQNVKNLKIKINEYKNDFYYTAIVCEQCKGLYIDTLLMYNIISYMNYKSYNDSAPLFYNDVFLYSDNEQNKIPIKKSSSYTNLNYNDTFMKKNKHRFISNTLNNTSHSLSFYKKQISEENYNNNDNDNISNDIPSSSCEHQQSDKDCVNNEDIKLDNMNTVIHKFVAENIPYGFILCTCHSAVLRYKSIRLKKEVRRGNSEKDDINGIKKYNVNNEKKIIFFSKIKNIILKLKNELSQIRGTIDNLFFSNKNNILLNNILNTSYFKDIPSIVYNHVHNIETKNDDSMDKLLFNNENDNALVMFQINKKENISNNYILDNINNFKGISEIDKVSNICIPIKCDNNIIEKKEINICENMKPSKYLCTNKNDKFTENINEIISKKYNQNDLKEQTFSFKYLIENYDIKNITTFFICCILSLNEIHTNLCIPFMKNNSFHNISSPSFGMEAQPDYCVGIEQNEIKIIDIINKDSESIKYNKIKETECFLEEYNIVLDTNPQSICVKQMAEIENTLCILSINIINKIKERYIEIMSVYLFIGEHIDDKNIKVSDLMKLIDNYGKIYLYLTSLNKIHSNKKKKLYSENNSIIKSFKLQISEMVKMKDKENGDPQNERFQSDNSSTICDSQVNKKECKETPELKNKDNIKCNDKINNCMIKTDELNEEINILKIKNKKNSKNISKDDKTIRDNNRRNSDCKHKGKYIKYQGPCSSSSNNTNSTCDETSSSIDIDKNEENIESEENKDKIEKVHYLKDNKYEEYNEISKGKNDEKKWKKKERNMKHINTINNIKINEMCNILFSLKEKIIAFLSYIYKKLCRNMLINIYYVKRLYTQIVNIFLNIPRDININYVFIKNREINTNMYIKKYNDISINEKYLELIYNKFHNYSHEGLLNVKNMRDKRKNKNKLKKIKYNVPKQYDVDNASSPRKNLSLKMDEENISHKDSSSNMSLFFEI